MSRPTLQYLSAAALRKMAAENPQAKIRLAVSGCHETILREATAGYNYCFYHVEPELAKPFMAELKNLTNACVSKQDSQPGSKLTKITIDWAFDASRFPE